MRIFDRLAESRELNRDASDWIASDGVTNSTDDPPAETNWSRSRDAEDV
jgi:hypothetical protein